MDKLKEQLAVVKEHSFWILCGGILLVSLVSWYMSTNSLQEQQKKYKGEIDTAVSTLNAVRSTPDHPNDSTNKGMDAVMQNFGEDVYRAWTRLAEHQEQVLVWGGIFGTDEKFQVEVRPLRPIETKVAEDSQAINRDNRRLYRDFIDDEIPKLADIILAKWQVDASALGAGGTPGSGGDAGGAPGGLPGPMGGTVGPMGGGGGGGVPGMPGGGGAAVKDDDPNVVVIWDPANQKEITQVHFGMATNSNASPSTLEVLYAHEDLWVFQNLMSIIKATNGDATRKHEAAIKYIEYVRIGRSAGDVAGQIAMKGGNNNAGSNGMMPGGTGGGTPGMMPPGAAMGGSGGPPGGAGGMMPPPGAMPGMGGMNSPGPGGGASGGTTVAQTVGSDRYVDLSYASIKDINRLRGAMKGAPTKPEDMLLAVAKRMPVRMQFKMDQRKLTTLLAECGNSRLPVEVRQVRINRGTASSLGGGGGGNMGAPPGGGGMMPGMPSAAGAGAGMGAPGGGEGGAGFAGGMMGMGGGGGAGARPASSIASSKEDPNEISVEVYGIVYIYNPPERKLLGLAEPPVTAPPVVPVAPVPTPTSTTPEKAAPPVNAGAATGR